MAIDEEKKEGEEQEAPPKKSKLPLIIIVVVAVLVIGGVAAFLVLGGSEAGEGEEGFDGAKHAEVHYETAKLEPFIVNLSESTSFIKVSMLVEYDPAVFERAAGRGKRGGRGHGGGGSGGGAKAESGGLPPLMQQREPMIRDAVIRILSSHKAEEVLSPEGKEKLKEELVEAINEAIGLEEGPVVNIYFTEFVIQ